METLKLHPTGRSEEDAKDRKRERELNRQELSKRQQEAWKRKHMRVKHGRAKAKRGLTKTHSVYGMLFRVCGAKRKRRAKEFCIVFRVQ